MQPNQALIEPEACASRLLEHAHILTSLTLELIVEDSWNTYNYLASSASTVEQVY